MPKTVVTSKLVAFKCQSCGVVQQEKGGCDECDYRFLKEVKISRKEYCKRFSHLDFKEGDKKLSSTSDCCTQHITYRCRRCGAKTEETSWGNSFGCMFHGSLS